MKVSGPIKGGMAIGPLFTEALAYDSSGQIIQQQYEHDGRPRVTVDYGHDRVSRLRVWGVGGDSTAYAYDPVGNRTQQTTWSSGLVQSRTNYAIGGGGPNQLSSLQKVDANNQLIGGPTTYAYDADGAVVAKTVFVQNGGGGMTPQVETFAYSWRDLLRKYTTPSNASDPVTDWRYRYSAGGEREQKRMYTWQPLSDTLTHTRAWVYYLLGGGCRRSSATSSTPASTRARRTIWDDETR